jgi:thymidylate kinase
MAKKRLRRGKLIIIEGPDGVGKTTISEAIAKYLNQNGETCELLSFPGRESGTIGKLVYDVHHDPAKYSVEGLTPTSKQALHIVAHLDAIERRILPTLNSGKHVVLDRFWWSTWVYGLVSGIKRHVLKRMIDLERALWHGVNPAAAFLIRRNAPINRDDPIEYWLTLSHEYEVLAEKERRYYPVFTIDNLGPLQDAVRGIEDILEKKVTTQINDRGGEKDNAITQLSMEFGESTDNQGTAPIIISHILPAKPTLVFDTYWRFAAERQKIFFKKLENVPKPWTDDPILSTFKFTNAYRASDRASQYLIRNVIYREDLPSSPREVFFRIILFKLFNKIETWQLLEDKLGSITYSEYSFDLYDQVLTTAMGSGQAIYSAAYIMPSGGKTLGHSVKHRNHLKLIEKMIADELYKKLADAPDMQRGFELLHEYPTIGDFLAYQFITDINYSELTNFSEMEFVIPGPGALDGIRKCFLDRGGLNEPEIIRFMTDIQEAEFERLGLDFESLWGRRLQLIDCQNLFCEVDKYSRVKHPEISGISGRTRIKQKYTSNWQPIKYWYPPKWQINKAIEDYYKGKAVGVSKQIS